MNTMMLKNVKNILEYLSSGFFSPDNIEEALKIYTIYTFSVVGFIFVFILGLLGFSTSDYILTTFLLGGALLLLINLVYLKITANHIYASYMMLYLFFALMIYLVYGGGVNNTGPLWIYALPPTVLFIHGFKKGLLDLIIFIVIISVILFYPNNMLLEANYSMEFKVRIVLSFILLSFFSSLYAYSREKSLKKMKKIQKDLEFFLKRDPLTGLYNRRGYHDGMDRVGDTHGVMLMCDIDYFKRINDTYGHETGDFVLQEVAQCIRENIRKEDVAIRWGGEEFLIFLSDTNINNGYLVGEKLRESIEKLTIYARDETTIKVTLSMGISLLNDTIPLEEAIRNADNAMYVSKAAGRNTVSKY
ncbi:MAG TPA: GGDEF domain-containing protein [Sulfurovum sp.]|nr:GGDEF domain-containing protein [Sulfurovum sp.]